MKVAIILLTYGNRPKDILEMNLLNSGYLNTCTFEVNIEGIANALNEGIDLMKEHNCDAVAFLANDIKEPSDWLIKKVDALKTYPNAGTVASSLDTARTNIQSELIISNYLISKECIDKIGYFNDSMFPYGPIDLDWCDRCHAAGFGTFYVMNCLAIHNSAHATGSEYGWSKEESIAKFWEQYNRNSVGYKNGSVDYKINRIVNEI